MFKITIISKRNGNTDIVTNVAHISFVLASDMISDAEKYASNGKYIICEYDGLFDKVMRVHTNNDDYVFYNMEHNEIDIIILSIETDKK